MEAGVLEVAVADLFSAVAHVASYAMRTRMRARPRHPLNGRFVAAPGSH